MPRKPLAHLALLLCLAAASAAHAADKRGGYMGGALGTFRYEEPSDITFGVSDNTTQYELFGGYRVSDYFAVEFGLARTQDLDSTTVVDVQGLGATNFDVSQYFDIYTLKALGFKPFDLFSVFGGAGYYSAALNGEIEVSGFGTVATAKDHSRGAMAALGVQRDFRLDLKSLSIRGEYNWYDFDEGVKASGFTLGVLFRF